MVEKAVRYEVGGKQFEGMLVYDDSVRTKRPAIFSQPDWKGVCPDTVAQAREVAGKDYVVLLADMYGVGYGAKPKTQDDLRTAAMGLRKNLPFILDGGAKALAALSAEANKLGLVDMSKCVAIGYCMGGGVVLEQARAGADFKGTVVFHVTLPNPTEPATKCGIKGRVLAIHGSADPVTPKPMIDALEQELTDAKIDWQLVMFGHAVHSFCDPTANAGPTRYDAKLCKKAYALMREFIQETV